MLPAARAGLLAELRQEQQEQRDRQRVVLRQHGMIFAEDCVTESTADRALSMAGESKSKWEQDALGCEQLLVEAVEASSTDHEAQSIANTLDYRNLPQRVETFWSSTGSGTPDDTESLTYRLKYPLSVVHSVRVQVYRALYQHGHPLYPAHRVKFEVGPSPRNMQPATGWMKMRASCRPQTFHLPVSSSASRYLRVVFWGKPQPQLEDMRYYLAIQRVEAFGWQIDPLHLTNYLHSAHNRPGTMPMCNGAYLSAHMCGATRIIRFMHDDRRREEDEYGLSVTRPVGSPSYAPHKPERFVAIGRTQVWAVPQLPPRKQQATDGQE